MLCTVDAQRRECGWEDQEKSQEMWTSALGAAVMGVALWWGWRRGTEAGDRAVFTGRLLGSAREDGEASGALWGPWVFPAGVRSPRTGDFGGIYLPLRVS